METENYSSISSQVLSYFTMKIVKTLCMSQNCPSKTTGELLLVWSWQICIFCWVISPRFGGWSLCNAINKARIAYEW